MRNTLQSRYLHCGSTDPAAAIQADTPSGASVPVDEANQGFVTRRTYCLSQAGLDSHCRLLMGKAEASEMKPTKITSAPTGFEYYRVCDQFGVCRVVRGMWAAQHLIEDLPGLTASKTKLRSPEWE